MTQVWLIAWREFTQNLNSRGYLTATFVAPLLILFLIVSYSLQKGVQTKRILNLAVVDSTHAVIDPEAVSKWSEERVHPGENPSFIQTWLSFMPKHWKFIDDVKEAHELIARGDLDGALTISAGPSAQEPYSIKLSVNPKVLHLISYMTLERDRLFGRWLQSGLSAQQWEVYRSFTWPQVEWVDDGGVAHITDFQRAMLNEKEKSSWVHIAVFIISVMLLSGYLVSGLGDEREQRVLEFLFTVVTPVQLLSGKVLGVVMSGLLQVVTWGVTFVLPAFFFIWSMKHAFVNWLVPFFFFFSGYVFYGTMLLALAAGASTVRESRQMAASWFFLNAIPLAFYPEVVSNPTGWISRLLSHIPLTSPITMIMRIGVGQAPAWEILVSLAILILSTIGILQLSSHRVLKNTLRKV